jgi:hypothetical protein
VVADTNIYVSTGCSAACPGSLLDLGLLQAFTLVVSNALLDELEDKLRVKFNVTPEDAAAIRAKLTSHADMVAPDIVTDAVQGRP